MLSIWLWVKKYWGIVLAIASAILAFFLGLSLKKTPVIVPGESPEKKKIEDETKRKELELDAEAKKKTLEAQEEYEHAVEVVVEDQVKKSEELKTDPKALNDYLHEVGGKIREK